MGIEMLIKRLRTESLYRDKCTLANTANTRVICWNLPVKDAYGLQHRNLLRGITGNGSVCRRRHKDEMREMRQRNQLFDG